MKNHIVIYISLLTSYIENFWCSSYGPKISRPIRLQDSLSVISQDRIEQSSLIFDVDRHQNFLQVYTFVFDMHGQTCPKYPK